jgi:endonuclease YncB( thermonuclease family)
MIEPSPRRQAALISTFLSAGFVIGFALTAAASGLSAEQTQLGGLEVIDGDTLLVSGRTREIDGIDAPELGQICLNVGQPYECGLSAAYALRKILAVDPVVCRPAGTDPARVECTAGQLDLAEILLRDGLAVAGRGAGSGHRQAEAEARSAGLSIWRGRFINPADWRAGTRLEPEQSERKLCPIVAIVDDRGRRLYLLPWDPGYPAVVKTGRPQGELRVCSDEEARAQGYARPDER